VVTLGACGGSHDFRLFSIKDSTKWFAEYFEPSEEEVNILVVDNSIHIINIC
jgi:hypothetical protein